MNFCSHCGARVVNRIPLGEDRPRFFCPRCRTVHYQNPRMVVGCIPEKDGRILLCRRAIEPRKGFWTIPAGFLENGESVSGGAMRETFEETGSQVEIQGLFAVYSLLEFHQVYLIFRARLMGENFGPTPESSEVSLFSEKDFPWPDLAFSTIHQIMKWYFHDRSAGFFDLHFGTLPPS